MQRSVAGLALAVFSIVALAIAPAFVSAVTAPLPSSPPISNLVNAGFETGDLTGWTTGAAVDFVGVLGPDGYATPYSGDYMLRLGTPRFQGQPVGNNLVFQDFVAVQPTLKLAYNIFTYDFAPYNHVHYRLTDLTTGSTIFYYSQTAWGGGGALKSTGWIAVELDISAHIGDQLQLEFGAGGTTDQNFATWAYFDRVELVSTSAVLAGTQGLHGWYKSDVTVTFEVVCLEGRSPTTLYSFDSSNWLNYSGPFTISSEGETKVYYYSHDELGNIEPVKETAVRMDKTPPESHAVLNGNSDNSGYVGQVTVSLNASDGASGVASTLYSLDGSAWSEYLSSFDVSSVGTHLVSFKSTDLAGNVEPEKNVGFTISASNLDLEAIIAFDPDTKTIKVYNSLTGAEVSHALADSKGGWETRKYSLEFFSKSLVLVLKCDPRGNEVKVKVVSTQYDGGMIIEAPNNELKVQYSEDKKTSIKELEQNLEVKGFFNANVKYSAKKDETTIKINVKGEDKVKDTINGMVLLNLMTEESGLKYGGY